MRKLMRVICRSAVAVLCAFGAGGAFAGAAEYVLNLPAEGGKGVTGVEMAVTEGFYEFAATGHPKWLPYLHALRLVPDDTLNLTTQGFAYSFSVWGGRSGTLEINMTADENATGAERTWRYVGTKDGEPFASILVKQPSIPTFTLTYRPGAYGAGTVVTDTVVKDKVPTTKGAVFTREGWKMFGWSLTDGGPVAVGLESSYYSMSVDVDLYPVWAKACGDYTYCVVNGTASIEGYHGKDSAVVVPNALDSIPVTRIGAGAFGWNTTVTSVMLPATVSEIGVCAFSDCSSLKSVILPESLKVIDDQAFYACGKLESVDLPDGVEWIGHCAFFLCEKLTNLTLGQKVEAIGNSAFESCDLSGLLEIPASVTNLGIMAFGGNVNLEKIVFDGAPPDVGFDVFWYVAADGYYVTNDEAWKAVIEDGSWQGLKMSKALPDFSFYALDGFPAGAFLTDSATGTVVRTTFAKGEDVYVRVGVKNCGMGVADGLELAVAYVDLAKAGLIVRSYGPYLDWAAGALKAGATREEWIPIGTEDMALGSHVVTVVINDGEEYAEESQEDNTATLSFELVDPVDPTYSVAFDANGGTGAMADQTIKCGESVALAANAFGRDGYAFAGWATAADGAVAYADMAEVKDLGAANVTVTLYAVWEPLPAELPNYAFHKPAGFPAGAFLADTPTGTVAKATFEKGETVYVRFCVGNFGKGVAADGETTSIFVDADDPIDAKASDVLLSGKMRVSSATIGTEKMTAGRHVVKIVVNNEQSHEETSYEDNVAELSFELTEPVVLGDPVCEVGAVATGEFPYGSYSLSTVVGFSSLADWNFDMESYPYALVWPDVVDAEKASGAGVDQYWCAQLADVNLLTYGGYAEAAGFADEDALADYLRQNPAVADGDVIAHVLELGGYDSEGVRAFLPVQQGGGALEAAFKTWFATGKSLASVGLLFTDGTNGVIHVVAACGYSVDPTVDASKPEHLTGLYYVDSDDDRSSAPAEAPNSVRFCDLMWDSALGCYVAQRAYSWAGVDYFGGQLYCDGQAFGYFLEPGAKPAVELPNYAFHRPEGFPAGAFLADTATGTVAKTTFEKGETVYVRFCVGNFGKGVAADGETTSIVVDADDPIDAQAADVLLAGKTRVSSATVGTEKMTAGRHVVKVVVNGARAHGETSYEDNVAELSFELFDPVDPTYAVAFDANGGTGAMADQTIKCGESVALAANAFSYGSRLFAGWATAADGAVAYADMAEVKDLGGANGTVTLYAVWELPSPDLPNYAFYELDGFPVGAFLADSPTGTEEKTSFTKGETVYIRYRIRNFGKGAADVGETMRVTVDEDVPVDAVAGDVLASGGERTSFFKVETLGMAAGSHRVKLEINAGKSIGETSYDDNVRTVTFDLVDPVVPTYAVAFDANGGEGSMESQTLSCGASGILSKNAFSRLDWNFVGWATSASGAVAYANGAEVKDLAQGGSTVVLYAVWEKRIVVKFNVGADAEAGTYGGTMAFDGTYALSAKGLPDWVDSVTLKIGASTYSLAVGEIRTLTMQIAETAEVSVALTENETKTARTADWTIAGVDGTPDVVVTLTQDAQGKVTSYKITYLDTKGQGNANPTSYTRDDAITFKPLSSTSKFSFAGWSPSSIEKGSSGDVTVTALWEEKRDEVDDEDVLDTTVSSVLNGLVYDADYALLGTIQVKVPKANKRTGLSKASATVQVVGQKKVTVKADFDAKTRTLTGKDSGGNVLTLEIGENWFVGEYGGWLVDNGVLDVFSSKKTVDLGMASKALEACKGTYALAFEDECGWSALSVTVAAKGKVKVSGTLANGTSVTATSQLAVGEESVSAPVIFTKKDVSLAFVLYFSDGEVTVEGLDGAVCGPLGGLSEGVSFYGGYVEDLFEDADVLTDLLPDGIEILSKNGKWIVSPDENGKAMKAGKVVWDKKAEDVNWDKSKIDGYNVSGLKLAYTAKTGLFKGSFKVYTVTDGQKLKSTTVNVSGIVVDGVGYGTATVKKVGSVAVTIE